MREISGKVTGCALQTLLKMYPISGILRQHVRNGYTEEQFFVQHLSL